MIRIAPFPKLGTATMVSRFPESQQWQKSLFFQNQTIATYDIALFQVIWPHNGGAVLQEPKKKSTAVPAIISYLYRI